MEYCQFRVCWKQVCQFRKTSMKLCGVIIFFFPTGLWFSIIYYYFIFIQNIQKWVIKVLVYSQFIVCAGDIHIVPGPDIQRFCCLYINEDMQRLRPILPNFRPLSERQQEFRQCLIMICEYVLCLLYRWLAGIMCQHQVDGLGPLVKWMSDYPQSSIQSDSMFFVISAGLLCFPQQKKDLGSRGVRYDPQHRSRAIPGIFFILHVYQRVCQSLSFIPLVLKCSLLQNKEMLCSFLKQVICLRFAVKTRARNTESVLN